MNRVGKKFLKAITADNVFVELIKYAQDNTIKPSKCKKCKKGFYMADARGIFQGPKFITCDDCAENKI